MAVSLDQLGSSMDLRQRVWSPLLPSGIWTVVGERARRKTFIRFYILDSTLYPGTRVL